MMLSDSCSIKTIAAWLVVSASLVACGGKTAGADGTTGSSTGDGDITTDSSGGDGDAGETAGDGDTSGDGDGDGDGDTASGTGDGDGDTTGGDVNPGDSCDVEGEIGQADCNTCTCDGEQWRCTLIHCGDACEDGATRTASDGCNTCTCDNGEWLCTEIGCGVSCDPADYPQDDGCNACSCVDGHLLCTDVDCPVLCEEYDTKTADDGCNTCTCSGGLWACTKMACGLTACGARAGDTCGETEYCAYEAGELCGAADAESVCKVRPEECGQSLSPVCGCDGKSYPTACSAAASGTGVLHYGDCEAEK